MYCRDCQNYNDKSLDNCRKKGQTSPLRKADDLECFDPKNESGSPADPDASEDRMLTCTRCGRVLPSVMFAARKKKGGSGTIQMKVCRDCMHESAAAGGKKRQEKQISGKQEKPKSKRPIKATVSARSADVKPKGEVFLVTTKSRSFQAKAAKPFSTQFDMIWPVYDIDRGGGVAVPLVYSDVLSIKPIDDKLAEH